MAEEKRLVYHKWYLDKAAIMKDALSETQIGIIFNATMDYARDGTIVKVPPELELFATMQRLEVDAAQRSYNRKCETNALNGAKGGKAKAANAKAASVAQKDETGGTTDLRIQFTPPTKADFKEYVKSHIESVSEELDCSYSVTAVEITELYDLLAASGWSIRGCSIRNRHDLDAVIDAHFCLYFDGRISRQMSYEAFEQCFEAGYNAEHDTIIDEYYFFEDFYNEDTMQFVIGGKTYPVSRWKEALEVYIQSALSESSEC